MKRFMLSLTLLASLPVWFSCNNDEKNPTTDPEGKTSLAGQTVMETATECFEEGRCGNQDCQSFIVGVHYLSMDSFDVWAKRFHDPILAPKGYQVRDINNMMSGLNCAEGDHIKFVAEENNHENNIDITLSEEKHAIAGKYSMTFFKGLIRINALVGGDSLLFYKVVDNTGKTTLAMKAKKANGAVVYCGDLVGLYP